jgi:Protein of unknown function (DUF2795)
MPSTRGPSRSRRSGYPTRKDRLVQEARSRGASRDVRETLERLPERRFASPTEVSEAIGSLG